MAVLFKEVNGKTIHYDKAVGNTASVLVEAKAPHNPYHTGYGIAVPTRYKVRTIDQRWRRVYRCISSDLDTTWIWQNGERIVVYLHGR